MNRFWQAFLNLFRIEDLRNRLFFTLALLGVYRLGAHIPTPGINATVLEQLFAQSAGTSGG
jgi:preprotein translocase subunit SecY